MITAPSFPFAVIVNSQSAMVRLPSTIVPRWSTTSVLPTQLIIAVFTLVTACFWHPLAGAAEVSESVVDVLPERAFATEDTNRYFTIAIENDMFGDGGDRHYTSGLRATWLDLGSEPWLVPRRLMDFFSYDEGESASATFYSLGHNVYTPRDITTPTPDPEDRPYAAFLYGSTGYTRASKNRIDTIELTLGVVGPWAFGEEIQSAVHDVVSAPQPEGWDEQLENELGVILGWERRWPFALRTDFGPVHGRLMPHVGLSLGNVYSHAAAGATWQIFPESYPWQSLPLRVRPAIPGSGFFFPKATRLGWSAFVGFEARAVARNIFLDGNTFVNSPSVRREPFVYDVAAGFSVVLAKVQLAYTVNWRSDEFKGQRDEQLFGAVSISRRF